MWDSHGDGRAGCMPSIRTASSVSNIEFGKVERKLSKKLNSTVVVYKSKSKPGHVYRLTVRMETSTCVADAANWGNIELAGTNPTYRPLPHRCESHITSHSDWGGPGGGHPFSIVHALASRCDVGDFGISQL